MWGEKVVKMGKADNKYMINKLNVQKRKYIDKIKKHPEYKETYLLKIEKINKEIESYIK